MNQFMIQPADVRGFFEQNGKREVLLKNGMKFQVTDTPEWERLKAQVRNQAVQINNDVKTRGLR